MDITLINAVFAVILTLFFVYLVIWTCKFFAYSMDLKRARRSKKAKEKMNSIKLRTIGCSKNYWYNKQDVEDCPSGRKVEDLYHYFDRPEECIKDLIIEMYDCGLVRTEILERIAYESDDSKVHNEKSTISLTKNKTILDKEEEQEDHIAEFSEENEEQLEAEDALEYVQVEDGSDISPAIRNAVYEQWVSYVFQLYEIISINANEEIRNRIRKELMNYGHKDIEILLHSPE